MVIFGTKSQAKIDAKFDVEKMRICIKKRPRKATNIDAKNQEFTKCCFSEKRRFPLGKQHFLKVEGPKISYNIGLKNNQKTCSKNACANHEKNIKKGSKKGGKIH